MVDAAALARQGAPHATAVVADYQTAGVGRHGNSWFSEPKAGLYLSIVLRLPASNPTLTMALGLAVQQAVNDTAYVAADLRWPNDVMLNDRKLAGIMIQAADAGALIAGIGINVNNEFFPPELQATSLRIETGQEQDKENLLQRVLAESLRYAQLDKSEIIRRFEQNSTYARGRRVIVDNAIRGITEGMDENGFLLVRTGTHVETILTGGVRPWESGL